MASINLSNIEKTKNKTIYTELSLDTLKGILDNKTYKSNNTIIIIKFGANWCVPCKRIKDNCNQCFLEMPGNVFCFDIDIDTNLEIYSAFKTKKMVKGVPAILCYYCKNARDQWYISDTSISGSDNQKVFQFFKGIYSQAQQK
jgi:thiol-disulfide isomerase/thioredoxin